MKLRRIIWSLAGIIAICLAYSNSFRNNFAFDDSHTVVENPAIRSLGNIPRFFTDASTFSVLPSNQTYRPVVSTTVAIDYALAHGYIPFWFHLDTFLFFLLLVGCLFGFYNVLLDKTESSSANWALALIGATWFGLHPAIAETVNYIIQRGDLYCTLGCVAALLLFARYPQLRKTGLYLLPLVFSLLSKPPAAVFPVLLFFYVFFFEAKTKRATTSLLAALPSLAITLSLMVLQSAMTPKTFVSFQGTAWAYRLTQPYVWLRYLGSLFLPLHLNVDTDLRPFADMNAQALLGLACVLFLGIGIWITARRQVLYPIAYGLIWFVVTQLPTSVYPLSEVENDHRMFFSFAGLIPAVVWGAWLLLKRFTQVSSSPALRSTLVACVLLLLCGYAYGVRQRNIVWHNDESLWLDDTIKSPNNGRGLMNYGLSQMQRGNYPLALDYFQRALPLTPNYSILETNLGIVLGTMGLMGDSVHGAQAEAHFLRGMALSPNTDVERTYYGRWLIDQGRYPEAIAILKQAVALNPTRPMQRELLIQAYTNNGDTEDAKQAATDTLRIAPDNAVATQALLHPATKDEPYWINLSLQQYRQGRYTDAIASAQQALKLNPKSATAYNNLGASYGALMQWNEAIRDEEEALKLQPSLEIAKNNLRLFQAKKAAFASGAPTVDSLINQSLLLNKQGKYQESIAAARAALKLNPRSAEAWNNIAANYQSLGQWDNAIAAAQKAIELKPDFQLAKNNLAWSLSQKNAKR